jgi:parallel beta-helix repeat protein
MRQTLLGDGDAQIHRRHFLRTAGLVGAATVGLTAVDPSEALAFTPEELEKVLREIAAAAAKYNLAIGSGALEKNTSGEHNVAVGTDAGQSVTGGKNVFIGYKAGEAEKGSNKLYIANSGTTEPLIGGNFETKVVTIHGALSIPGEFVSVKAYGAKGNGVANDTKAIQEAINAVIAAGGGQVYFPPGEYLVGASTGTYIFNIESNVSLTGAGPGISKLKLIEAPEHKTGEEEITFFRLKEYESNNVTIEGLTINANEIKNLEYGVNWYFGTGLTIRNTTWENFYNASSPEKRAIFSWEGARQRIVDNTFIKCYESVSMGNPHSETWIERNTVKGEKIGVYGIILSGGGVGVSIAENRVEGIENDPSEVGVEGHGIQTENIMCTQIVDNTVANCKTSGIHVAAGSWGTYCTGNTLTKNGEGIYAELNIGLSYGKNSEKTELRTGHNNGATFVGNTCYENKGGIGLSYSPGCTVSDNFCYANAGSGISCDSERCVFSGNVVFNNMTNGEKESIGYKVGGFFVYGVRCTFIGNVCYDNQEKPTQEYGIALGNGTGHVLIGNQLERNAKEPLYIGGGTSSSTCELYGNTPATTINGQLYMESGKLFWRGGEGHVKELAGA